MAKKIESKVGPITASGTTKTSADEIARARAAYVLSQLERARPQLVAWKGLVSLVYPVFTSDGAILYQYTNPRSVSDLHADSGCECMGTAGYWDSASNARSAVLCHMISSYDEAGIPDDDDLPPDLNPKDRGLLISLRQARP